jgi:hypothetical protein
LKDFLFSQNLSLQEILFSSLQLPTFHWNFILILFFNKINTNISYLLVHDFQSKCPKGSSLCFWIIFSHFFFEVLALKNAHHHNWQLLFYNFWDSRVSLEKIGKNLNILLSKNTWHAWSFGTLKFKLCTKKYAIFDFFAEK